MAPAPDLPAISPQLPEPAAAGKFGTKTQYSLKSVRKMVVSIDGFSKISEDMLSGIVITCTVSPRDF